MNQKIIILRNAYAAWMLVISNAFASGANSIAHAFEEIFHHRAAAAG